MKKNINSEFPLRKNTRLSSKKEEIAISGWHSCLKLFEKRPQDVLRVYFSKKRSQNLHQVKRWCANRKLPYRQLTSEELSRVAASVHHEGVVMVTRPPALKSTMELLDGKIKSKDLLVALDRVSNTHNLGAILRTAAFFGVKSLVIGRDNEQATLTPSTIRIAEGALESVSVYDCRDMASFLRDVQGTGVFVLGAEPKTAHSLYEVSLRLPCVLVMGNEGEGLSDKVKQRCNVLVHVPGKGQMQSLNVSVAASIIMNELFRIRENETIKGN